MAWQKRVWRKKSFHQAKLDNVHQANRNKCSECLWIDDINFFILCLGLCHWTPEIAWKLQSRTREVFKLHNYTVTKHFSIFLNKEKNCSSSGEKYKQQIILVVAGLLLCEISTILPVENVRYVVFEFQNYAI